MNEKIVRVLFVGGSKTGFSPLFRFLEEQQCQCRFASSYTEGARLFAEKPFDLVLSSGQPGIRTLFPLVIDSSASVFCAHIIEDGYLWLPVVLNGGNCLGVPPLQPSEFAQTLRRLVDGIKTSDCDRIILDQSTPVVRPDEGNAAASVAIASSHLRNQPIQSSR